jgi:hypothetical protein
MMYQKNGLPSWQLGRTSVPSGWVAKDSSFPEAAAHAPGRSLTARRTRSKPAPVKLSL